MQEAAKEENWDVFVNACASITAFVEQFTDRAAEFKPLVKGLITVCSDKMDIVRKNAAILMAKLVQLSDECMK